MLLQKNKPFKWQEHHQSAFEILKEKLVTAPILTFPKFDRQFYLHCDACDKSVGAVLLQKDDEKRDHVIAYASKCLNKRQKSWPVTEKECYSLVYGVTEFRPYLYNHPFTIISDHSALQYLLTSKHLKGRLLRWSLLLSDMDITSIRWQKGSQHAQADYVSRLHTEDDNDPQTNSDDEAEEIPLIHAIINTPDEMTLLEHISEEQANDPYWGPLMKYLQTEELPANPIEHHHVLHLSKEYILINEKLYKTQMNRRHTKSHQLAIPTSLRETLL